MLGSKNKGHRAGGKPRPNRYNPNAPDWNTVHRPVSFARLAESAVNLIVPKTFIPFSSIFRGAAFVVDLQVVTNPPDLLWRIPSCPGVHS